MRNFHIKSSYLRDLQQKAWSDIETLNNPNDMWSMWKDMPLQSIDKHAPLKSKRVGNKKALWMTDHPCREMHKRDFLKEKAMLDRKQLPCEQSLFRSSQISREEEITFLFPTYLRRSKETLLAGYKQSI